MSNRWKYSLFSLAAFFDGLLFASIGTKVTYSCPLLDGAAGCISAEKAVMHPGDLFSNYQDSLSRFALNLLVAFVIVLVPLIVISGISDWVKKRKRAAARVGIDA